MLKRQMIILFQLFFVGVCFFFGLVACHGTMKPLPAPTYTTAGVAIGAMGGAIAGPTGALMGGMVGGSIGNYLGKQATLVKQIRDSGVQVFQVGDSVTLVLPADRFFQPNSPAFNVYSYPTLDKIVLLLRPIDKIAIKVAAYTDNQGSPERNQALSMQWAESIGRYLWERGVDTRLLYTDGYGECDTVASNKTTGGRMANRRIEITFYQVREGASR